MLVAFPKQILSELEEATVTSKGRLSSGGEPGHEQGRLSINVVHGP